MTAIPTATGNRWLLLLHEIPAKPQYLRVKLWRRLNRLGAVAIKKGVYILPRSEERNEDLQWVIREAIEGGGEASLCEASFIQGVANEEVEALFNRARDKDYAQLGDEVRKASKALPRRRLLSDEDRRRWTNELRQLKGRLAEISSIDFFDAAGRESTRALISDLEARVHGDAQPGAGLGVVAGSPDAYRGRTWVTRKGVFVDRIGSAWLIRRFIDPDARFKFVPGKGYAPGPGELRFDMFDAEFTHVGDRCTFEVLIEKMGLQDRALRPMAEVVHDIDVKDGKFGHDLGPGLQSLIAGIAASSKDDDERLARGSVVFNDLYEFFRRNRL